MDSGAAKFLASFLIQQRRRHRLKVDLARLLQRRLSTVGPSAEVRLDERRPK